MDQRETGVPTNSPARLQSKSFMRSPPLTSLCVVLCLVFTFCHSYPPPFGLFSPFELNLLHQPMASLFRSSGTCYTWPGRALPDARSETPWTFSPVRLSDELAMIARASEPLVPKYSPEDIERLVHETKLCPICQVMFGPREIWRDVRYLSGLYEHQSSPESLARSVEAGCPICTKLKARWTQCQASLVRGELQGRGDTDGPFQSKFWKTHTDGISPWGIFMRGVKSRYTGRLINCKILTSPSPGLFLLVLPFALPSFLYSEIQAHPFTV